jgi:hypothetical protein
MTAIILSRRIVSDRLAASMFNSIFVEILVKNTYKLNEPDQA